MRPKLILMLTAALLLSALAAHAQAPTAGQIAISGVDGNIYLYDVASATLTPITQDATFTAPEKFYSWPTWSTDGRLAFFGVNLDPANTYRLGVFIQQPGGAPKGVFAAENEVFTYAYWSPADCPSGNCRDLALLYSTESGLATRLVRSAAEVTITEISQGGPFYWDWSPDGASMLWARFGQNLEVYDVASGQVIRSLPEQQGLAQAAVDWSPVDDRLLTAVAESDGTTSLVIFEGEAQQTVVSGLAGGVAFEWSPQGDKIAFLDLIDGGLHVVDAASGASLAQPAQQVLAFFWSPDGSKIAFINFASSSDRPGTKRILQPGIPLLQWNVYEVVSDKTTLLAGFTPTGEMVYYLNFFDQFLHSHRLWSPDSRYLVYGEVRENGTQTVSLLDVTAPTAAPQVIAEGTMGVFSW